METVKKKEANKFELQLQYSSYAKIYEINEILKNYFSLPNFGSSGVPKLANHKLGNRPLFWLVLQLKVNLFQ